jgi:hypothetical protein
VQRSQRKVTGFVLAAIAAATLTLAPTPSKAQFQCVEGDGNPKTDIAKPRPGALVDYNLALKPGKIWVCLKEGPPKK